MIQFILMLLGLAFGHNNAHTSTCNNNNNGQVTTQLAPGGGTDPGEGVDPGTGGSGGDTGGDTGPVLPPKI